MEIFIFEIFILNILFSFGESFIVIPFKTWQKEKPSKNDSPLEILTFLENNNIYSTSLIGTPSKNITIFFHSQNFSSNIFYHMCDFVGSSFERKSSSSFNYIKVINKVYPMENASLVTEKFYFYEDLELKKTKPYIIQFIYSDNEKEIQGDKYEEHDYTCMSIGLKRNRLTMYEPETNFIERLFKSKYIETYDFTLEYLTENEGRIIIGDEPYIYNTSKSDRKYKVSGAIFDKRKNSFYLNFDNIYMMNNKGQKEEMTTLSAKVLIDLGVIIGPEDYRKKIKELFFDNLEGKCYEDKNNSGKIFYYCDKSAENDIKNNFPTLYFHMQLYFKTFELTYKDLFIEKNGKFYFLIYFKSLNYFNYFEIGKILLKKYIFTFNQYNNHIGYYNEDIKIEGEEEPKKSFWQNIYFWIIIGVLFVIFAFLGFFIGKKVRDSVRKKRLNEVDDDNYDYVQPENEDKKLFNSEKNAINE